MLRSGLFAIFVKFPLQGTSYNNGYTMYFNQTKSLKNVLVQIIKNSGNDAGSIESHLVFEKQILPKPLAYPIRMRFTAFFFLPIYINPVKPQRCTFNNLVICVVMGVSFCRKNSRSKDTEGIIFHRWDLMPLLF